MRGFILVLLLLVRVIGHAQDAREIGVQEHLNDTMPTDIELTDVNGNTVQLGSLFNKPTVLSLVYYRCPGICTPLMDGITELVNRGSVRKKPIKSVCVCVCESDVNKWLRDC